MFLNIYYHVNSLRTDIDDASKATRKRRQFYLLGFPLHSFAPNRLPTNGEMLRRYYWLNLEKSIR